MFVGLDFGTTNSALAVAREDGTVSLARFDPHGGSFRSILWFHQDLRGPRNVPVPVCGPDAIERALGSDGTGRLLQSFKSHLASRLFTGTNIFSRNFTLDALIAAFLNGLRTQAENSVGGFGGRAVVGRPVRFSHAETAEDDALAISRMTEALAGAGFDDVRFEYEPVAAAYFYQRALGHDELVLVADFGGGTSDFCLMRVGPSARMLPIGERILGTEGVALAGDVFDAALIRHLVAPSLGLGSHYRSYMEQDDKRTQPVPPWIYSRLERWHLLSFLKSHETMKFLGDMEAQSLEPKKIAGLIHVIEDDLGYALYRAVERTKVALSRGDEAELVFDDAPVKIRKKVKRAQFEKWIAPTLETIAGCVERLLITTGVPAAKVDRVFLTGGSSFVPAVRRLFEDRFGAAKLADGDELTSVAQGLALRALEG